MGIKDLGTSLGRVARSDDKDKHFQKLEKRQKLVNRWFRPEFILKSGLLVEEEKYGHGETQRDLDWIYKSMKWNNYENYSINWKSVNRTLL